MYKSFKIRLYPTKEQEDIMRKHIGACRFIWNYMLDLQEQRYQNGEKYLFRFDMIKLLVPLKKQEDFSWLQEVSSQSLNIICTDLSKAYDMFFNKIKHFPKFKSKKQAKQSFPLKEDRVWFDGRNAHIEKIGLVKYRADKDLLLRRGNKFINPRVKCKNGKWILSLSIECENQAPELTDRPMGIDLGVKETMTVAYGNEVIVFHNINKSKQMRDLENKIKHTSRSISRKYEANRQGNKYIKTKNIEREEDKLRKLYARQANIRNNYNHQCTHKLVSLLPSRVVMEDLNVQGMMKNRYLSKSVKEQCFYEITKQMKYKCEWNGIPFIQVGMFYPSSKTCSNCGHVKKKLDLDERTYVCSECGFVIDRDLNAAINLQRYTA